MLVDARLLSALGGMDEDFFLYYEEVALCRAAWRRGRSVEYDPALSVVHLRPLQNRRVSPRMRIVTRHSRLLFFQKQGSKAQFWAILWLTRVEAVVRGAWASVLGRTDARRAWRGVAQIVRDFSAARPPRGAAVRRFADAIMANPPVTTHLDRRIDARGSAPPSPALPATARPQSNGSDDSPTIAPRPICLDGSHGREHGS